MVEEQRVSEVPYVESEEDIKNVFQSLQDRKFPNITKEESLDYMTRILYFFERGGESKLTPETDNNLKDEPNHKKLITVPKETNNFIDYQKGDFIPVCKIKKRNPDKASENDILISIDPKKGVVWARVTTQKLIFGNKNRDKVVGTECFCVANYCIPNLTELVRGKNDDIIHGKGAVQNLQLDYSLDYPAYKREIAKAVLQVSRMDVDTIHQNEFYSINGFNLKQKKLLKEYFTNIADPPHFHFIYKDYVLYYKEHDGSAMAINSNDLTKYLIDLSYAGFGYDEDIVQYNFGMPFVDIKKKNIKLDGETSKKLLSGFASVINSLSDNGKKQLAVNLKNDIVLKTKHIDKLKNKDEYNKFLNKVDKVIGLVVDNEEVTMYDTFDPLIIFALQTSAISKIYDMSRSNFELRPKLSELGNDFYNTIEFCLSSNPHKKSYKDNSYYYNGQDWDQN